MEHTFEKLQELLKELPEDQEKIKEALRDRWGKSILFSMSPSNNKCPHCGHISSSSMKASELLDRTIDGHLKTFDHIKTLTPESLPQEIRSACEFVQDLFDKTQPTQ